ncbi:acetyl-CoA carboxylase carboxyltransferase subunit alpha [Gehongia tenuis]|uniref:Acetyl-coenzyme A carboxylase carboxyl transferase subunit alpha n=1 Tax=Gehongia tenuis TaxID=2763655 RepID=A0A926HNA5_9FIRM|nr:acetyl-CoA carboxylase carboxyltransferase subunit alpha [Gehongia tenuis]MBC8530389.1 acetyl-CoA carboxylase carboxyltransferase subunit alpha [Gehongia tenuis]
MTDAWRRVQAARDPSRPTAQTYISAIFEDFMELHGDRVFGDDPAVIGGVARLEGRPVTVIGQEKGVDTKDKVARNFGCAHPEGYRKALRLMHQAEKFRRPVLAIVDTQGAFCGIGAEERGQGQAIAQCLMDMMALSVPAVCVLVGEGGSGGALALACGNRVAMLENAVYSILSPEGFASILWKDASRVEEAAASMKMTAAEVRDMGIVDAVIAEPEGGASAHPEAVAAAIKDYFTGALQEMDGWTPEEIREQRYRRFRAMGAC